MCFLTFAGGWQVINLECEPKCGGILAGEQTVLTDCCALNFKTPCRRLQRASSWQRTRPEKNGQHQRPRLLTCLSPRSTLPRRPRTQRMQRTRSSQRAGVRRDGGRLGRRRGGTGTGGLPGQHGGRGKHDVWHGLRPAERRRRPEALKQMALSEKTDTESWVNVASSVDTAREWTVVTPIPYALAPLPSRCGWYQHHQAGRAHTTARGARAQPSDTRRAPQKPCYTGEEQACDEAGRQRTPNRRSH